MLRSESWRDWLVLKFLTRRKSLPYTSLEKRSAHATSWGKAIVTFWYFDSESPTCSHCGYFTRETTQDAPKAYCAVCGREVLDVTSSVVLTDLRQTINADKIEKLRFILNRRITSLHADREAIMQAIDRDYSKRR